MLPTLQTLCHPVVVSLVNYGLELIWKESFMVSWRLLYQNMSIVQGKGKAIPLQAWTGPEGSRKLRFPDFVTTAQDGGRS